MGDRLLHPEPPHVVRTELRDCIHLCSEVRQADRDEVRAASGGTVLNALVNGFHLSSQCWTLKIREDPIAMFGVAPVDGSAYGSIWLLGSDRIQRVKWHFLRESRPWLRRLMHGYDSVGNVVDKRNTVHIRWLEWLGFTFVREIPAFGHEGRPFLEFIKLSHV